MTSPFGPLHLIVNPQAGRGAVAKTMPHLLSALKAQGLEYRTVETTAPGHAAEAARQILDAGGQYIVAVGGDGTVHEVVNGMFDDCKPVNPDAVLGVAAGGSGCDFVRTFGLDRKPQFVAKHLGGDQTMDIDIGVAEYVDADGNVARSLFANIAEVGYGAEVVRRAARYPRWFGRLRYLLAAYASVAGGSRPETTLKLAHTEKTAPMGQLVVANCQFFGGGMKVAPRALPDDGKFNVQMYHGRRSQFFLLTIKLYQGEHLPDPEISEWQSATAELAPTPPQLIEADGEVLGHTPARFWLLERALRLKI
jgi:diacylglycerol kinase (ATP)